MKLIKILGLTAVAAIASMAVLSASASANNTKIVLCKKAELNCTDPFPNPTTIVAHAVDPKLLTTPGTVLCPEALVELEVLNVLTADDGVITAHVKSLTFTGPCKLGFTVCTYETTELGLLLLLKTGALTASVKFEGNTKIHSVCGASIDCTYGGEPALAASSTAAGVTTVTANETELSKLGGNCPSLAKWHATFTILGAMWLES